MGLQENRGRKLLIHAIVLTHEVSIGGVQVYHLYRWVGLHPLPKKYGEKHGLPMCSYTDPETSAANTLTFLASAAGLGSTMVRPISQRIVWPPSDTAETRGATTTTSNLNRTCDASAPRVPIHSKGREIADISSGRFTVLDHIQKHSSQAPDLGANHLPRNGVRSYVAHAATQISRIEQEIEQDKTRADSMLGIQPPNPEEAGG